MNGRADYNIEYVVPDDASEHPCKVDKIPTLFRRLLQPHEAVRLWKQHLVEAIPTEMLASGECTRIVLDVEDTFLALDTKSSWRYAEVVARVKFNSTLSYLADLVVARMGDKEGPHTTFIGAPLQNRS